MSLTTQYLEPYRYMTLVEGIAGGTVDRVNTGPRAPDGFNLWPALLSGGPSPRTEVVHQVSNQHYNALNGTSFINGSAVSQGNGDGCLSMAIRIDNWKLIVGNPGDHRFVKWPNPDDVAHAFGSNGGGEREAGTEHCVSLPLSRASFVALSCTLRTACMHNSTEAPARPCVGRNCC